MTVLPLLAAAVLASATVPKLQNPAIDAKGFAEISTKALAHRETRRLSEAQFIRASREPGTVILDARSPEKYDELHVKGAINLSYPDISFASLARVLPNKRTRILIYCNNNFRDAEGPFPAKAMKAPLNLPTYVALYTYGYRNVYELGPLLDLETTHLQLESTKR